MRQVRVCHGAVYTAGALAVEYHRDVASGSLGEPMQLDGVRVGRVPGDDFDRDELGALRQHERQKRMCRNRVGVGAPVGETVEAERAGEGNESRWRVAEDLQGAVLRL